MHEQPFASPGEALEHYGIKGMRWGVRKEDDGPLSDVPTKTRRMAKNDAAEFTKAKLYYGEGAGIRRKLIKAQVEERSKDPLYKKAFDHHVENTDLGKRATQATKTRKRTDRKNAVKKTGRGVGHIVRGNNQYANTTALAVAGAGAYLHNKGLDRKAFEAGRDFVQRNIRR